MEQSHGEGQSPLLAPAEGGHSPGGLGQLQQLQQLRLPLLQGVHRQSLETSEVLESLLDGELHVEADVLRHVSHQGPRQANGPVPGDSIEHRDLPRLQHLPAQDAGEESGLATPAGAQQGVDGAFPHPHGEATEDGLGSVASNSPLYPHRVAVHPVFWFGASRGLYIS